MGVRQRRKIARLKREALARDEALYALGRRPYEPPGCQARREGDEIACGKCELRWDHQDPEPPRCPRKS